MADLTTTQQMSEDSESPAPVETDSFIDRTIESKYVILELLGKGAIGRVYRARRVQIGDEVAIKFLHKQYVADQEARQRFRREAKAVGQIHHPNIVVIHEVGETNDKNRSAYIVMELVEGRSLKSLLEATGKFPVNRAVALMFEICKGVGAAHRNGVVHRDLKPDNVIVCPEEDEVETVKVLDFGLAKLREAANDPKISRADTILGTPLYMSPEQWQGSNVDARSDVYSLSAMFYEMITGAPPFSGNTPTAIRAKLENESPPAFASKLQVPPELAKVIIRGLAKDPDLRPENATQLAKEVRDALSRSPQPAAPEPKPSPPGALRHDAPRPTLPGRFDFGIVTVNFDERNPVREILDLKQPHAVQSAHGYLYEWGTVGTQKGQVAYVVHGATGPNQRDASELVLEMTQAFDPDFILVLGAAVGLQAQGSKLGQVVYSRCVRSSASHWYVPHPVDQFEEACNLPPDETLLRLADNRVGDRYKWRAILGKKKIRPPEGSSISGVTSVKTEIFSGPDGYDDFDAPLFKVIQDRYPRVTAVELEGSATVSYALLQCLQRGRSIGYLTIKGIADFVDDGVNTADRRKRRATWTRYASAASAAFAHALIRRWTPGERRHTNIPARYLQYLDNEVLRNNGALVIHHLFPENYSFLCKMVSMDAHRIFAVCAFEPNYFLAKLTAAYGGMPPNFEDKHFLAIANNVFPHFAAFRDLADRKTDNGVEVTRIVLAPETYEKWKDQNQAALELFAILNGNVECYVAEVPRLKSDHIYHTTDHVIFNSNLLLDYYHDSQILIMGYEESGSMHDEFIRFETHFDRFKHAGGIYKPLPRQ